MKNKYTITGKSNSSKLSKEDIKHMEDEHSITEADMINAAIKNKYLVERDNGMKGKSVIYCIKSLSSFNGWYKIGQAKHLSSRLGDYNTGNPFRDFIVVDYFWVDNANKVEKSILKENNSNYEWIQLPSKEMLNLWLKYKGQYQVVP